MRPIQSIYKQQDTARSILYAWFTSMNTRVDIVLCNRSEAELKAISNLIYDKLNELEKAANYFDESSELSVINRRASQEPVKAQSHLFAMIWQCVDYNKLTSGCFDVTVKSDNYSGETISSVILDIDKSTVFFQQEGTKIDLSGYLKGYALEEIRRVLEDFHISDALINLGNSSVLALGNHPNGNGWKLGMEFPTAKTDEDIVLKNQCLTTSGNDKTGRKHIISPHTGTFAEGVRGVSVVTDRATDGEVLSTALFIASPEQREEILQHFGAKVYDL